jgi:hypothetical protein
MIRTKHLLAAAALVGEGFYTMFRIYYPKDGLFDGTWKLPDVKAVQ